MRAELGPRVVERLRAFEAAFDGPCPHPDRDQWAQVSALRSSCLPCLRRESATAPWERPGPCDVCGRMLETAAALTWAVGTGVGVIGVLRLCDTCVATDVLAQGELIEEDDMAVLDSRGRSAIARRLVGRPGAVGLVASGGEELPCCERCYRLVDLVARTRSDGRRLRLHGDCAESLGVLVASGAERARERSSRRARIVAAKAGRALAAAERAA